MTKNDIQFSIAGCRPEMGKWAALVNAAHSARFFISGRHSAIENGTDISKKSKDSLRDSAF